MEFKVQLPDDNKKYMKNIIAYANTSGGKIIIGVDDVTKEVVGVDPSSVFKIMDKIANAVSDMCVPQIVPDITFQTMEGKCIVQVEIYPGQNRPYYIRSQGAGKSFDEVVNVEADYNEEDALRRN